MRTIYKYECTVAGKFTLNLPVDSVILDVQVQNDRPCIWAVVEPDNPTTTREFQWAVTGGNPPENSLYHSTVQLAGGEYVAHLFELYKF